MLRLKALRKERGYNQQQMATILGITQPTLSNWESGKFELDNASLMKLADFFNVSTDYLLGYSNSPDSDFIDGEVANKIKQLRKQHGISQTQLAQKLNVHQTAVSQWELNRTIPDIDTLKNLSDLFGVSVDYLLGRTDEPSPSSPDYTPGITEDFVTFPVIGEVAAGYDHIVAEDWEGEKIDVPTSYLRGRPQEDYFVLKVKGDSMYPAFQDGDRVLVLRQETLNYSGQIGVILYGDDNATLKKVEYKMGEDWMNLIPVNPLFPPRRIENEELTHCRVLGIPRLLIREIQE